MKKDLNMGDIVNEDGDFVVINIPLHLFRHNMEKIVSIVVPLIESGKFVVANTENCPYPSTEVIEVLLRMFKMYNSRNEAYRMPIVNPSTNWKKVFKIVNIDMMFQYFDDIDKAKDYYLNIKL